MKATIHGEELTGTVHAPGSKSYSQRLLLFAGADSSPATVHGVYFSEDEQTALGIIRSEGAALTFDGDTVRVEPNFSCPKYVDVGESATSYRLSLGILSAKKCKTEFVGKPDLAERPVSDLTDVLSSLGAVIEFKEDGFVTLDASSISIKDTVIDRSKSSQFVSAMLSFYAFSEQDGHKLTVKGNKTSEGYIEITLACLDSMGFRIERSDDGFTVLERKEDRMSEFFIERDYSSAAYFLVLGLLASDDGIMLEGLPDNSLQSDAAIMDVLKSSSEGISVAFSENRPVVKVVRSPLMHVEINADEAPDLAPAVAVLGIFLQQGVTIKNPGRLRIKESDRYAEIVRLSESFGARVETGEDYIEIRKGQQIINPDRLSFEDHRMIMSAIIAGLAAGFEIEYDNIERINKSYPGFLEDLKRIGATIKLEPVVR